MKLSLVVLCALVVILYIRSSVEAHWHHHHHHHKCKTWGKYRMPSTCCTQRKSSCCLNKKTGQCYCDAHKVSLSMCSSYVPVNASDSSHCCGRLDKKSFLQCTLWGCYVSKECYIYTPSSLERNGRCMRTNAIASSKWDQSLDIKELQHSLPEGCHCVQEEKSCFAPNPNAPTTTTTTTTAAATKPATTSTPTTTTTPPTTTPTTTTTTPTTTTTTPTTTPKPSQLCPTPPPSSFARLLGGTQLTDLCKGNGVLKFYVPGSNLQLCSAVLGYNPATQKNEIYITDFCKGVIQAVPPQVGIVQAFNGATVAVDVSAAKELGNQISTVVPPVGYLPNLNCKTSACVYNSATMKGLVDFNSCYITTIGQAGQPSGSAFIQQVNVTKQPSTSCTQTPITPSAECFTSVQAAARGCSGDSGAPVFCQLSSTKETVLYGLLDVTGVPLSVGPNVCGSTNEFHIVPIP